MAYGDATIMDSAIWVGIIFGVGYLLVFPFWIIHKLDRLETRLKQVQEDSDDHDDSMNAIDRRLDQMDEDIETRRKEVIEAIQLVKGKIT